jgi:hypothetical protein
MEARTQLSRPRASVRLVARASWSSKVATVAVGHHRSPLRTTSACELFWVTARSGDRSNRSHATGSNTSVCRKRAQPLPPESQERADFMVVSNLAPPCRMAAKFSSSGETPRHDFLSCETDSDANACWNSKINSADAHAGLKGGAIWKVKGEWETDVSHYRNIQAHPVVA